LLADARKLAYDVGDIDAAFRGRYGEARMSDTDADLVAKARERWQTSLAALEDSLKVQAGVVGNLATNREELEELVGRSQGATGALQASQAGNQLLALQAQQLTDLTATLAAIGRAQAIDSAQRAAAASQAREQMRRFLTPGPGYRPTDIEMFP
jgi:P-type conjugative transfer protein TrbJ